MNPSTNMRKLVIAGTYAEYRDYLVRENLHQRAAPYIHTGEQLASCDPGFDEIVLVGGYVDNPAYQSRQYWEFQGYRLPQLLAV